MQKKLKPRKILHGVEYKWNSIYIMLKIALEYRASIYKYNIQYDSLHPTVSLAISTISQEKWDIHSSLRLCLD